MALIAVVSTACASSPGTDVTTGAEAGAVAPTRGSGATVALTRVGEAVQLTEDAETTHECEFVAHLPLTGASVYDVDAMRTLRNEAGSQGANLVLLVMETRTRVARAEGYLCAD